MRRVINRLGRVAVFNQLIGLAVVRVRLGIGNAVYDQFLLCCIPYHNDLDFLGIGIIRHPVIRSVRIRLFCNGEVVGSRTIQRHVIEAAVYALLIGIIGGPCRNDESLSLNGILGKHSLIQLLQRVRQTLISQLEVKLESEFLRRIAGKQLFNIQLDFDLALVAYSDLIRLLSLGFCRQFQHKCGLVIFKDFSCSTHCRICSACNTGCKIVAFSRLGFLDHIFLPPVEAGNLDLAVCISFQFVNRAVAVKRIDTIFECELQSAAGGGGTCILIERAINLKLRTSNYHRRIVCGDLGDFQVA